jgi:K+-sensing histidine kinase KdpD
MIPPEAEFLVGGLVCALAALAASALAAGHSWQAWIPLLFSAILFLTALIFGAKAGLLGSVLAAVVFAMFLFSPIGKISVADQTARTNLGWMILTGIAFSFLFAPPRSRFPHR